MARNTRQTGKKAASAAAHEGREVCGCERAVAGAQARQVRPVGDRARPSGELAFYAAHHGARMVGFAAVHRVPASLRLSRFWQLRDLFADPATRRQGIGRRLVETVWRAAADAGAVRLSLQTERDNTAALALYRQCGFSADAEGLTTLSLAIPGVAVPERPRSP